MDKYEYRVCVDEINALIAERRFAEAMEIAETIDWKRVKNVNMLCKISDLFKINRKFEESRDILEMAHDRYPGGRSIVYGLCELELRLNNFVKAVTYYEEFVAMAPRDSGRYILQYKIYVAQGIGIDERIAVLEELKKHDYREKWAYTLASLYNQAGMTAKCAQECDEMIAAFGDGRYVIKALQLKQEKTPLTADQTTRLEELTRPIPAQEIEEQIQQPAYEQPAQQDAYGQDGQYAGQPAYEQEAQQGGYAQEGQYAGQPAYEQAPQQGGYVQDGQYADQAAYEQEVQQGGYAQEGQYAGQPAYQQATQPNGYAQEGYIQGDQYDQQSQPYEQQYYSQEAYGQQVSYEGAAQYAGAEAYGQEQPYPTQEQGGYAENAPYADNATYGEGAPYAENASYADNAAHGAPQQQNVAAYGQQGGYGAGNFEKPQDEIRVKPLDDSQFNTLNLQQTVAAGVKELLQQEAPKEDDAAKRAARSAAILKELQENEEKQEKEETEQESTEELIGAREYAAQEEAQEAQSLTEGYGQTSSEQSAMETEPAENIETPAAQPAKENVEENKEEGMPIAEATGQEAEAVYARSYAVQGNAEETMQPPMQTEAVPEQPASVREAMHKQPTPVREAVQEQPSPVREAAPVEAAAPAGAARPEEADDFAVLEREVVKPTGENRKASWGELPGEALWQQSPEQVVSSAYDAVLAQETDGQYSMSLEERDVPEKQITGQLDIEGIMAEWEKIRRDNEEKRAKENRQRVLQNTGPIIAKFEETSKKGVLEHMEREIEAEARSRRQREARPAGSALSDGLTSEERQSAAVAAGHVVERAILEDDIADEATKKWSPSAVLRTLRKEQALQDLPEDYFPQKEEKKQEQVSAAQDTAEESLPEETGREEEYREELSHAEPEKDTYRQEEAPYEEEQDDAYGDDGQDEAYLPEQDPYAEEPQEHQEDAEAYEDRVDPYGEEEPEDEEEGYGEQEEEDVPKEPEQELQADDAEEAEEPEEEDMPVRRARNTPVEALHETQDLTEFAKGKYGDPEQMSENQKEERRRSVDENRSQRQHSGSEEERVRAMTREERALFGPYLSEKNSRRQILQAIENVSLAACTGNVIVTGDDGPGVLNLAKGLIREIQLTDQNFSGKVARSTGEILNRRDFAPVIDRLKNGALIIERAGELNDASVKTLRKALQSEERGLIIILVDTKKAMDNFLAQHQALEEHFTARVNIQALDNHTLVRYAKAYARSKDYSIDEFGVLALHTRISSKQTIDHSVTMREVRDMVDDAIYYASKKSLSHLMDILLRKRYDENDRIILREKDFQHY